ncbi:MAG: hypothetical protein ABSB19_03270 [Methylomonas sp.]|jgi:hypothetical protein
MLNESAREYRRRFRIEEGIFILLLMLSLLGIIVTHFSPEDGYPYWLMMVVVFATLAVAVSWFQSRKGVTDFGAIVKEQSLHWICALIVVGGAFMLQQAGRFDEPTASLIVLLILSLATMLDGIRIGWQFFVVGFFQGACAIIIAYTSEFMIVSGFLAILIIAASVVWEIRTHKRSNT